MCLRPVVTNKQTLEGKMKIEIVNLKPESTISERLKQEDINMAQISCETLYSTNLFELRVVGKSNEKKSSRHAPTQPHVNFL